MNRPDGAKERTFCLTDFGAVSGAAVSCTASFAAAVRACTKAGGGTVAVPAGTYLTGPIRLTSGMTLHLEDGARVVFSDDPADYPLVESRWEGVERPVYSPQVYGVGLTNVALTGRGILDGRGDKWWKLFQGNTLKYPRPRLIGLKKCANVSIEGITLVNSPSWTVHPLLCDHLTIDRVAIVNPPDSPNTDGIDPESCRHVRISGCRIDVGDDCIALKAGEERCRIKAPCEHVAIDGCIMRHGHGGVVMGSEMSGGIRDVAVSDCVFDGTDRGIRIKSRRGRGGVVEDIRVDGVVMRDVLCPLVINMFYHCGPGGKEPHVSDQRPRPVDDGTPAVRGIHVSRITAHRAGTAAGFFLGLPEAPLADVVLEDVAVDMTAGAAPGRPAMMDGLEPMRGRGLICGNMERAVFRRISVTGQEGPALTVRDARRVDIMDCAAASGQVALQQVEEAVIDGRPYEEE